MDAQEWIEESERHTLHVYNRSPIVLERGEGVYLYDTEGNKYLDFAAGIGVCALGYGNREYEEAVAAQLGKLIHTSNLFYNPPITEAAKKLCAVSGMDRAFFTNSGTEAVEGAIKAAKKYAYEKDGRTDHEIIAMERSFHGRTLGALAVTGNAHYREPFEPLPGIVRFAKYNDLGSVRSQVTDKTCAIILETVQGEGGVYPASEEFLKGIKELCEEKDILLILDEIQCGMGRTGTMFACQSYGVRPDILACGKALGGGLPVGAFLTTEKVAGHSLKPGDHGTTYGGNPLAGAAVCKVLEIYEETGLTGHVREVSAYLEEVLLKFLERHACVKEERGMGLLRGLELSVPAGEVSAAALKEGLLLITAGSNVLRFIPPLVIGKEHVDEMAAKLEKVLESNEKFR